MTKDEFLSLIKSRGANIIAANLSNDTTTTNVRLQEIRASVIPAFLSDLYTSCAAIILGPACIFGLNEIARQNIHPLPSIVDINIDAAGNKNLYGKTIFGRNDLFWFATDALGNCYMLDNLTLSVLRKYEDPYRAMLDCLIVGKI